MMSMPNTRGSDIRRSMRKAVVSEANRDVLLDKLCQDSIELVEYARRIAASQINLVQLMTFYSIGKWIVEVQQQGEKRAKYGKQVIKKLSESLTARFGRGFSVDNLENMRKFYITFKNRISETLFRKFTVEKSETLSRILEEELPFQLSFSHYLILCRIQDDSERHFYEMEAVKAKWSVKVLGRQYGSSLYERLLVSKDKEQVLRLAQKGQVINAPSDAIKDPYVLEFLGLKEENSYSEDDLESRIIDHLQEFLMEMGTGFTFVGRQVRFTFEEDHFRVDLVLYNRLLRCFVLIDLKTEKLRHQDLGQMQMYVNYYDRYEKTEDENPTIGILLCKEKNDAVVELTLPKDSNIYASKYELYLPDKKILQQKLKEWIAEETGGEEA
mgnify:CR=1 FL=1